ncbi:MAG TPA: GFA family protein [Solirubrobacteraceae bacterium]|nr:GFA family protein [Solirubrobacteraceae bacterium]
MTEPADRISGGCLCGGVRYQLSVPFRRANFCHCSRCRKHSGAAALAQGRAPISGFTLLQGGDLLVNYAEPGHMAKVFCRRCGSSLFGGRWPDGPEVSIRLGTLDTDAGIAPSYHSFTDGVPAWDTLADDGLPRYPRRPPRDAA